MVKHVPAIVEDGLLRPLKPLEIPDGREVELVVRLVPIAEEIQQRIAALRAMRENWRSSDEGLSDEWEEFDRSLRENRSNFPECPDLFGDDE